MRDWRQLLRRWRVSLLILAASVPLFATGNVGSGLVIAGLGAIGLVLALRERDDRWRESDSALVAQVRKQAWIPVAVASAAAFVFSLAVLGQLGKDSVERAVGIAGGGSTMAIFLYISWRAFQYASELQRKAMRGENDGGSRSDAQ